MVSIDDIYLLQRKVESAVQKIEQLKAENGELRKRYEAASAELSEKNALLSSLTADGQKIEDGIKNALDRLDSVENSILDGAGKERQKEEHHQPSAPQVQVKTQGQGGGQVVTVSVQTPPASQEATQEGDDSTLFGGDTSFATEDEGQQGDIF